MQYLTKVQMSLLTDGNAFVATPRDRMGVPTGLVVLDPTKVKVERDGSQVVYRVGSGSYSPLDIMHVPGIMLPGSIRGLSPIGAAREVVEGASEAQKFGKSWFANASVPPAVIKIPATNDGPGDSGRAKRVAQVWHETHGGTSNAGKVGVLTDGAELQSVAVANKDSQWLESRQFSGGDYGSSVFRHLIADSSNSTSAWARRAEPRLRPRPTVDRAHRDEQPAPDGLPVSMKLNSTPYSARSRIGTAATPPASTAASSHRTRPAGGGFPIPGGDPSAACRPDRG